jgi:hypothetical protein
MGHIKNWKKHVPGKNLMSLWVIGGGGTSTFGKTVQVPWELLYDILSSVLSHSGQTNVSCSNGIIKSACINPFQRFFLMLKIQQPQGDMSIAIVAYMLLLNFVLCGLKGNLLWSSFIGWMVKHDV